MYIFKNSGPGINNAINISADLNNITNVNDIKMQNVEYTRYILCVITIYMFRKASGIQHTRNTIEIHSIYFIYLIMTIINFIKKFAHSLLTRIPNGRLYYDFIHKLRSYKRSHLLELQYQLVKVFN